MPPKRFSKEELRARHAQRQARYRANLSADQKAEICAKQKARRLKKWTDEKLILERAENAARVERNETEDKFPTTIQDDANIRQTLLEINKLQISVEALKKAGLDIIKMYVQSAVAKLKVPSTGKGKMRTTMHRERRREKSSQSDRRELQLNKEGFDRLKELCQLKRKRNAQQQKKRRAQLSDEQILLERQKNKQRTRELRARLTDEYLISQWHKDPRNKNHPVKISTIEKLPILITNKNPNGNKLFVCIVCHKEFEKRQWIQSHYCRYHVESEIVSAKTNQLTTGNIGYIQSELRMSVYKCELYPEKTYSISRYKKHAIATHGEDKVFLKKLCHVCSFCNEPFVLKLQLKQHLKDFHGIFTQCPICNENVKTEQLFKQHVEEMHSDCSKKDEMIGTFADGYFCTVCGFANRFHRILLTHSKEHSADKSFQCEICEQKFDSRHHLKFHNTKLHMERLLCCEFCGKQYTKQIYLKRHKQKMHLHNTNPATEKIKCKKCEKLFSSKLTYRVHFLAAHENKRYECNICEKTFTNPAGLYQHKITVCEKEKGVAKICPICGKYLANYLLLFYHKANFHKYGNTEENVCHVCNKAMKGPPELFNHNNTKHRTGKEKETRCMICAVCEKSYQSKRQLFTHWLTHKKEKLYGCNLCNNLRFIYRTQFYTHRKQFHRKELGICKIITDEKLGGMIKEDFNKVHATQFVKKAKTKPNSETNDVDFSRANNPGFKSVQENSSPCDSEIGNRKIRKENADDEESIVKDTNIGGQKSFKKNVKDHDAPESESLQINESAVETTKPQNISPTEQTEENLSDHGENNRKTCVSTNTLESVSEKPSEIEINNMCKNFNEISRANIPVFQQSKQIREDEPRLDMECQNSDLQDSPPRQNNSVQENIDGGESIDLFDDNFDEMYFPQLMDYSDSESFTEDTKPLIFANINFHQDPFKSQLVVQIERLKECLVCSQVFPTLDLYESHINSKGHRAAVRDTKKNKIISTTKSDLTNVQVKNPGRKTKSGDKEVKQKPPLILSCLYCNKKFTGASVYRKHMSQHKIRANCLLCTEKFSSVKKLIDHYISKHNGEKIVKCEICNKAFLDYPERSIRDHMKFQHSHIKRIRKKFKTPDFTCDLCGMIVTGSKSFTTHLVTHENDKHKCVHCAEELTGLVALENHYNETHNGEMPFPCLQCSQKFLLLSRLQSHEQKVHSKDKFTQEAEGFHCDKCDKIFKTSSNLLNHKITHESVDVRQKHICHFCAKSFFTSKSLTIHLREHTGEKPYPCTFCDLAFISLSLQKQHVDTVHQKNGHVCEVCGKSFNRRKYLVQHLKSHTSYRYDKCAFPCNLCPERFKKQDALERHLKTLHDPTRPFECDQCSCRFKCVYNLKIHMMGVHKKMDK